MIKKKRSLEKNKFNKKMKVKIQKTSQKSSHKITKEKKMTKKIKSHKKMKVKMKKSSNKIIK